MPPPTFPFAIADRVVVIDDDPDHLDMLVTLLERAGYNAVGFSVPRDGLYYLLDHPATVAVIDLCMPDLNGIEMTNRLQTSRPELPVIAISGADDVGVYLRSMRESGAHVALRKPVDPDRFLAAVRDAVARRSAA
jgi:FixJ family two-component response regulator